MTLRRLSGHPRSLLHVQLTAEHGERALSQDFHVYAEDLRDFGTRLEAFPPSVKDEVLFECGADDPRQYCWVRLRAYVYDRAGHTALEFLVQNNSEPPVLASALFSVKLEAATLNRLGQELAAWSRSKQGLRV